MLECGCGFVVRWLNGGRAMVVVRGRKKMARLELGIEEEVENSFGVCLTIMFKFMWMLCCLEFQFI